MVWNFYGFVRGVGKSILLDLEERTICKEVNKIAFVNVNIYKMIVVDVDEVRAGMNIKNTIMIETKNRIDVDIILIFP